MKRPRFKDPTMERHYQAGLTITNPKKVRVSSFDQAWLEGYEGKPCKYQKNWLAYAFYVAGQAIKKAEK